MSSFVISKKEYVKAAGFIAGLASQKNFYREPLVYWYSFKKKRILTPDDYYDMFVSMYRANAKSVQLQYNDKEPENDPEDYKDEFQTMITATHEMFVACTIKGDHKAKQQFINSIFEFHGFSRSVNYQIEDEELNKRCNHLLDKCQTFLVDILQNTINHYEFDSWATFNLASKEYPISILCKGAVGRMFQLYRTSTLTACPRLPTKQRTLL